MTYDFSKYDVKFKKGKQGKSTPPKYIHLTTLADQIQAISTTTGLMSGRLIGLHSYKIKLETKIVETNQLVEGCISNLVYFNSKKIAFFTKDNNFVYKYIHTGKLSKFCIYHKNMSNFSIGNALVKDPHEENLFVISGKNQISIYGDIGEGGLISCQEITNIDGCVNYILPGYKKGVFFVVTQDGKVHSYIYENSSSPNGKHQYKLVFTYLLNGFTTCASICPKTRYISIGMSNLQGRLTKLVILEAESNLNLSEYASVDYTKCTEALGKKNNSFFSDIVTTYLGGYPLITCIQRAGDHAMSMYLLKGHYMSEIKSFQGYFSGQVFRACLMKCRPSLGKLDSTSLNTTGQNNGKWDCKIWTVDEGGQVKSVNIRL